ncbi:MAG: hypothetical protein K8I00_10320 [Candidatus Omnitrophica bacterium]|nr:hypothetical protein [Candidatus Omnitrophota bacterium]
MLNGVTTVVADSQNESPMADYPTVPAGDVLDMDLELLGTNLDPSSNQIFTSKYASIYYVNEDDLNDFIWRLGGAKLEFTDNPEMASHRLDRLVNRVQMILDMWPTNFAIRIHLYRGDLKFDKFAYYNEDENTIYVHVDYNSDGVMAHELAHAVINHYFPTPPPSKVQEILAQYVDRNLWSDYY